MNKVFNIVFFWLMFTGMCVGNETFSTENSLSNHCDRLYRNFLLTDIRLKRDQMSDYGSRYEMTRDEFSTLLCQIVNSEIVQGKEKEVLYRKYLVESIGHVGSTNAIPYLKEWIETGVDQLSTSAAVSLLYLRHFSQDDLKYLDSFMNHKVIGYHVYGVLDDYLKYREMDSDVSERILHFLHKRVYSEKVNCRSLDSILSREDSTYIGSQAQMDLQKKIPPSVSILGIPSLEEYKRELSHSLKKQEGQEKRNKNEEGSRLYYCAVGLMILFLTGFLFLRKRMKSVSIMLFILLSSMPVCAEMPEAMASRCRIIHDMLMYINDSAAANDAMLGH